MKYLSELQCLLVNKRNLLVHLTDLPQGSPQYIFAYQVLLGTWDSYLSLFSSSSRSWTKTSLEQWWGYLVIALCTAFLEFLPSSHMARSNKHYLHQVSIPQQSLIKLLISIFSLEYSSLSIRNAIIFHFYEDSLSSWAGLIMFLRKYFKWCRVVY